MQCKTITTYLFVDTSNNSNKRLALHFEITLGLPLNVGLSQYILDSS